MVIVGHSCQHCVTAACIDQAVAILIDLYASGQIFLCPGTAGCTQVRNSRKLQLRHIPRQDGLAVGASHIADADNSNFYLIHSRLPFLTAALSRAVFGCAVFVPTGIRPGPGCHSFFADSQRGWFGICPVPPGDIDRHCPPVPLKFPESSDCLP